MKRNKTVKIVAVTLAVLLLAGGGTAAGVLLGRNGKTVNVFSLYDIGQTDLWMDQTQYEGNVRAENLQAVYLSDTQQLKEIFVKAGDSVKKGDRLAAFDTTLSDLELDRQQITVQKLELNLAADRAELRRINGLKPYVPPAPAPEPEPERLTPADLPLRTGGDGSPERPFVYLWNDACVYDEAFVDEILPRIAAEPETAEAETVEAPGAETAETPPTAAPVYAPAQATVVFQVRESDNPKGALRYTWGMVFTREPDGGYTFTVFEPDGSFDDAADPAPEIAPDEDGGGYTAAEIAQMRAEKQAEIRDAETQLKTERLKLRRLELEINTGVVTAALDGVVRDVATEEEARSEGKPVVTLSAGGAWRISAYVGELDLETLSVGAQVQVESWMDQGGVYEGKITEISHDPVSGGWYGGNGNPNVSYYPVTVEVAADAALQDGDYVSVTFNAAQGGAGLYVEAPFILKEGGRSYVYAMGENGRLEKRAIRTGKIYWGSTVEIVEGLTQEDYIAFPYGKDVRVGAKTVQADPSALYEGMYW